MSSHYLNHCWYIVNWTHGNKLQWHFVKFKCYKGPKLGQDCSYRWPITHKCIDRNNGDYKVKHVLLLSCFDYQQFCTQIAKFMGPKWGPPGSCWPQVGPMLAPLTLLSGWVCFITASIAVPLHRVYSWSFDVILCVREKSGELLIWKALSWNFFIIYHPQRPYLIVKSTFAQGIGLPEIQYRAI